MYSPITVHDKYIYVHTRIRLLMQCVISKIKTSILLLQGYHLNIHLTTGCIGFVVLFDLQTRPKLKNESCYIINEKKKQYFIFELFLDVLLLHDLYLWHIYTLTIFVVLCHSYNIRI